MERKQTLAIYTVYGFSALCTFNTILCSLEYFMQEMPEYKIGIYVSFCFNALECFCLLLYFIWGSSYQYAVKNNMSILIQSSWYNKRQSIIKQVMSVRTFTRLIDSLQRFPICDNSKPKFPHTNTNNHMAVSTNLNLNYNNLTMIVS